MSWVTSLQAHNVGLRVTELKVKRRSSRKRILEVKLVDGNGENPDQLTT